MEMVKKADEMLDRLAAFVSGFWFEIDSNGETIDDR